jgi:hypothetical protein
MGAQTPQIRKEIFTMKKFFLGMVIGVILIGGWYTLSANYKARQAEQAARAARDAAAVQGPVR